MRARNLIEWRRLVLERDKCICQVCGTIENIEAHHIKQSSLYPELMLDVDNGKACCYKCHKEIPVTTRHNSTIIENGIIFSHRTVVQHGGSLVMTLPIEWIKANGIKKGDELALTASSMLSMVKSEKPNDPQKE